MSSNILQQILDSTRDEVERRKQEQPLPTAAAGALPEVGGVAPHATGDGASPAAGEVIEGAVPRPAPRRLREALTGQGIAVIAEIKRRSPSAGELRPELDVAELASIYERSGASAISVLTEGPHFGGSLTDLQAARAACGLPILRKDFVVDPYQLHEALAAGADAVLLIVAALQPEELSHLKQTATALGLDTLVEVHDEDELAIALSIGVDLVGINNRDLRDFSVDVNRTFELVEQIPDGVSVVSESGIRDAEQLQALEQAGVAAVLVGESLVRAGNPGAALKALLTRI